MFHPFNGSNDHNVPNSILLEEQPYFSSYYHSPSPLIYNEIIDNLGEFLGYHELTIIQQGGFEDNNSLVLGESSAFGGTSYMDSDKGKIDTTNISILLQEDDNNNITRLGVSHGSRRRNSSKTDRHSKISTAHGLRDRRMRLSLRVACPFFNLQDMLGFDKASKTIEWLLFHSKSAIEEQYQRSSSSKETNSTISSISEYEVESVVIEERNLKEKNLKYKKGSKVTNKKHRAKRSSTKELRKEARDRARKRTLEKMQSVLRMKTNYQIGD